MFTVNLLISHSRWRPFVSRMCLLWQVVLLAKCLQIKEQLIIVFACKSIKGLRLRNTSSTTVSGETTIGLRGEWLAQHVITTLNRKLGVLQFPNFTLVMMMRKIWHWQSSRNTHIFIKVVVNSIVAGMEWLSRCWNTWTELCTSTSDDWPPFTLKIQWSLVPTFDGMNHRERRFLWLGTCFQHPSHSKRVREPPVAQRSLSFATVFPRKWQFYKLISNTVMLARVTVQNSG